jgi:hypothetical protein
MGHIESMKNATKTGSRKIKAEIARIRRELGDLHPLTLGRGLTPSEGEVVAYLKRDLSRLLPLSGEPSPVVDSLFR